MRWISLLLALPAAACATAPGLDAAPSRRAVAQELLAWEACGIIDETTSCSSSPRRIVLTSLRCVPSPDEAQPGRLLCAYSGRRDMDAVNLTISGECAYLVRRSAGGGWSIQSFPDADMCESLTPAATG